MKSVRTLGSFIVTSFVLVGCVTAGKYNDLDAASKKTEAQLAACESNRTDLEKKLGITSSQKTQLEGSVADMKKALDEADARKKETEKRLAEFRDLTAKFKTLVDSGKLTIKVQNGRLMIALSTDILFPSGSAELSGGGKIAIGEVSDLLKDMDKKFQIEGHTDNVPMHSKRFPSNWELASARAISVLNTMLAAGLSPDHVSAASYASSEPIADNSTKEGKAANRRIDIVIVPDLSGLPGFDELNRISGPSKTDAASPSSNQASSAPANSTAAPASKADSAAPAATPAKSQ